jgi:hypothetical protein
MASCLKKADHLLVRRLRIWIAVTLAVVVLSGCGASAPAGEDFPDGVIAQVGERTLTGAELGGFMAEVRVSYEAHHRPFPEPGSAEYAISPRGRSRSSSTGCNTSSRRPSSVSA